MENGKVQERQLRVKFKDMVATDAEVGTNEMDALETLDSLINLSVDDTGSESQSTGHMAGYIGPGIDCHKSEETMSTSGSPPDSVAYDRTIPRMDHPDMGLAGNRLTDGHRAADDQDNIQYVCSVGINDTRLADHDINRMAARLRANSKLSTEQTKKAQWISSSSRHSGEETWLITWRTGVPLILAYVSGVVSFITFFHLDDLLPRLEYPLIGNLLDWDDDVTPVIWWNHGAVLVLLLWCLVYLRRFLQIVISLAMVRPYQVVGQESVSSKTRGIVSCVVMVTYHVFMGAWLGWACNIFLGYNISDLQYVVTGVVLLAVAEIAQLVMTVVTLKQRKQRSMHYRITKNILDIVSWLGFTLVSLTLPAFVHLGVRICTVFVLIFSDGRPTCC